MQVLKLACVAVLWGMAVGNWFGLGYGTFLGVLAFYLLLVIFVGTKRGTPRI